MLGNIGNGSRNESVYAQRKGRSLTAKQNKYNKTIPSRFTSRAEAEAHHQRMKEVRKLTGQ